MNLYTSFWFSYEKTAVFMSPGVRTVIDDTVISQLSLRLSSNVQVIVAVPSPTAVTMPFVSTVATSSFDEV